ncbi:hypothetical protein DITRI_Ditri06bG0054600 [Diplodiscus trichospermus]
MAAQTFHHTRSNSFPFPSKPNLVVSQIDEHLNKLKASDATSTSLSRSHKLNGLQNLYDCVDRLLQLPFSQQALSQGQKKRDGLMSCCMDLLGFWICATLLTMLCSRKSKEK